MSQPSLKLAQLYLLSQFPENLLKYLGIPSFIGFGKGGHGYWNTAMIQAIKQGSHAG